MSDELADYIKYRGKCRQFSEQLIKEDPTLRLVRGYYYCPTWNKTMQHWWCEKPDGTIVDPTKDQFPSKGLGTYEEFNGMISCEFCGKEVDEREAYMHAHHAYCSSRCFGRDVYFG